MAAAPRFSDPLLLLAGGADRLTDVTETRRFFDAAGSGDKKLVIYEGFRHELFNERERERPLGDAVTWFSARAG
jgi:alpha-beta hydrolase superfamily lysophospholipase